MKKKSLITGTLILTFASLITRLLGFVFRVYMSNVMGAEGMGLYQLLFPIYMLLWAASSAGISLAISKMVAEYTSKGQHSDAIRVLKVALAIGVPFSTLLSILLYFFAPFVATYFIHEPITELSIRILASCIPFMCTACCIRGYFQGRQEMSISAIAQIGEQAMRMLVIYFFASFFIPKGLKYACALGVLGMCAGEVFSFIMTIIFFKLKKYQLKLRPATVPYHSTLNKLLLLTIPITANRFLTSILQSLENILIPIQLQKFGLSSHAALGLYGEFSGMALPLLFFPSMVTMSLSTVLVPTISEAAAMKNQSQLQRTMSMAIQFSSLIGVGATALFFSLSREIALSCYGIEEVGHLLKLLAIICPFLYLQNILMGAMNGLGMQKQTFKTNIIGSLICISTIFLIIPKKGILGFVVAMLLQSGTVTTLLLWHVLKNISLPVDVYNWIMKPIASGIICSLFTISLYRSYLSTHFSLPMGTMIATLLLGCSYLLSLFALKCLTLKDIKTIVGS
ncbi:polysaccharide biosynthesis protein [Sporanaerobium hydrogeniformans]|uniref:Polysaccharide biosynthesis protein n=1 Tax=Sporanaerobium hydrogeniformans TaxID=3072179 RepID=A0AC61DFQ3_9FIRM|nr:polysaccharide biosynthesis protein [Sporanaerobium hydrogeniformans]PHV72074.1 polysaccharide biosynthesis protein [Sporanaerobium hydrogeniformans]